MSGGLTVWSPDSPRREKGGETQDHISASSSVDRRVMGSGNTLGRCCGVSDIRLRGDAASRLNYRSSPCSRATALRRTRGLASCRRSRQVPRPPAMVSRGPRRHGARPRRRKPPTSRPGGFHRHSRGRRWRRVPPPPVQPPAAASLRGSRPRREGDASSGGVRHLRIVDPVLLGAMPQHGRGGPLLPRLRRRGRHGRSRRPATPPRTRSRSRPQPDAVRRETMCTRGSRPW
jgi:hypothetical protein